MYYQIQQMKFAEDYDQTQTLDEGYYYYVPFCKSGSYSYQITSNNQDNGFYVYVLTPETAPASFVSGSSSAKYYPSCSGEYDVAYISYSNSCNVPFGSKLLVYNKDDLLQTSAIQVKIQIIDTNDNDSPDMTWNMEDFEYDQAWLDKVRSLSAEFTSS